ncbi:hypothetical protein GCM10022237_10860 [Nocardioides ginsengisoli]|uniref:RNHCP domain-containing protein n=1 Tax=Nocardioides ginsengisoli TaxID=363868 RepID=A0ABW3W9L1_9ACTN
MTADGCTSIDEAGPPEDRPDPRIVAARVRMHRLRGRQPQAMRQLECLSCEKITDHLRGPVTYAQDGSVLVQWWTCSECREGQTVG